MYQANEEEKKVLEFWTKDQTFEKSVNQRPADKPYVFYDGPPFATGLPHYGHIVASLMKDVVPRYATMNGFRVERRWGWDCHGLPIENIIEKDLALNSRKDILEYGIGKFNEACRATVLKYADEWKKTIKRMGRFVDMENDYKTMDPEFMESVWWVFRQLWDSGLVYKGHKAMHVCPRCVTALSNFEVTQAYKELKDLSVIAKFKITDEKFIQKFGDGLVTSFVAWTTTPWSIPTTMGLALGPDFTYVLVKAGEEQIICVKDRLEYVTQTSEPGSFKVVKEFKGKDLAGLSYEPPFDQYAKLPEVAKNAQVYKTHLTDYVSVEDGTGIVTINGAFGEIDYDAAVKIGLPVISNVSMDGVYDETMGPLAGKKVKPIEDPTAMDVEIMKILMAKGALWRKEKYTHSYPHCWRCDTPLLNYLTDSWFVSVTKIKDQLIKNNQEINWIPEHIKDGRFGKWLEGSRDWAVSRSRYWGTPLPVWASKDGEMLCIGSIKELEDLTGTKVTDLHKHLVDDLVIKKDGKEYKRIPEVFDCWFESGSMPYGQMHYPFENKEKFEASFPAEFIAEGQDQTRGWFYTLHILACALTGGKNPAIKSCGKSVPSFKNVIVNGIVLAEDGKKMAKKLKNYPDPELVMEKYGADAVRFYLVSSPVMEAEGINFSEAGVREMFSKVVNTLYNVLEFYQMFAEEIKVDNSGARSKHVLDVWILAKLNNLVSEVTQAMNEYRLAVAARPILDFITELSQWYVRRSRDRFKGEDLADKEQALATLKEVLLTLAKVMAPFTPFIAEKVWHKVSGAKESVHLQMWPKSEANKNDAQVLESMQSVRKVVELGLAARAEAGIKVRQVLAEVSLVNVELSDELKNVVAEELNVKRVLHGNVADPRWVIKEDGKIKVALDTEVSAELKKEGLVREVIRTINQLRKEANFTIQDRAEVVYDTADTDLLEVIKNGAEEIKRSTLTDNLKPGSDVPGKELELDGKKIKFEIKKS